MPASLADVTNERTQSSVALTKLSKEQVDPSNELVLPSQVQERLGKV